jgi:CBS-domain-containing membrane protein
MTSPVITVGPDASVGEAARTMHGHQVKRLIVVDPEARVIGVVSRRDLLKTFLGADAEIQREVVDRVIGEMLWLDPATIDVQVRAGVVTLRGQVERRSICPILVELVTALDGVVGVEDRLSYAIDDVSSHRLIA